MNKKWIFLGAATVLALATGVAYLASTHNAGAAAGNIAVGEPAPAFSGIDTKGKTHTLSDYEGKVVVLEWTNHDCPYVQKHYNSGNMQNLQNRAAADGAVWLRVISSAPGTQGHVTPAQADEIATTHAAAPAATILDESGEIGMAYGAKTTPHMYVIDKEGTLVFAGGIDDQPSTDIATVEGATNYVTAALDALKAGNPVQTTQSRPYGCNVKYK